MSQFQIDMDKHNFMLANQKLISDGLIDQNHVSFMDDTELETLVTL